MASTDLLIRITGICVAVCGVYALQTASRSRSDRHSLIVAAGWVAITSSLVIWAFTSGADKGVALGAIAVIIAAMGALLRVARSGPARKAKSLPKKAVSAPPEPASLTFWTGLRRIWVAALIGPVAGLAALAACAAGFAALRSAGMEHTANLTIVSFGFPIMWALFAFIAGFDRRLLRKTAIIFGGGLAPLSYLALTSATGGGA
ncbi:MAG: hypothetical protein AAGA22_00040 [Pseudomonadota bacterium]